MRQIMQILLFPVALALGSSSFAGEVSRAIFTTDIDNREPVSMIDSIDAGSYTSISFFTELNGMNGQIVTHQWTFNDKVMFEKTFEVKAERWRVWTSKTLIPSWTGVWTVHVLDDDRSVLSSKSFEYR